jgi:hypothetical protein
MKAKVHLLSAFLFSLVVSWLAPGCGKAPPSKPKHDVDIRGLWHVYVEYMTKNQKPQGAKNSEELREWATNNMTKERLELMAVYDLEAAFISPRDNLPYVVLPINKKREDGGIIIHEAKGVDGKRFVAFGKSMVQEMTEEEFRNALR